MTETRRSDIGLFDGTTYVQLIPPPSGQRDVYVVPPRSFIFHNEDSSSRVFIIEYRKGGIVHTIFNEPLDPGEGYAWLGEIVIESDMDGVWGKLTTTPGTPASFSYNGGIDAPLGVII